MEPEPEKHPHYKRTRDGSDITPTESQRDIFSFTQNGKLGEFGSENDEKSASFFKRENSNSFFEHICSLSVATLGDQT